MSSEPETLKKKRDGVGFWVLFATVLASSMAFINQSALNVALPAIQRELDASGADLLWIVNAFQLFLGALLLVGGALGDRFGRKRVFMIGIAIYTVGSALCGLAPTAEILIITRALQGLGGALTVPGSLAIITAYFDGKQRGQAIGTWSSFTTMASVAAPILGGFLADIGAWRGIFYITIPLALAALWALWRYVPESRDDEAPERLDYLGAVLITLGLAGIVYGATEIGRVGPEGLGDPRLLAFIIAGLIALVLFVWVEYRSDHPLMRLRLFRSRTFSGANLLTLLLYGALGGALFFLPLNLVQVQGYSATLAGLVLLPFSILLTVMSPWAGGLVDKYGPRLPLTIGPILVGFGYLALALVGQTSGPESYWTTYFPGAVLLGLGMGVTVAPLTTSVMGSVPRHSAGVASGVNNAVSRSAGVLAVAIFGGIALIAFTERLEIQANAIDMSAESRQMLLANAGDLAEVPIPDDLTRVSADQVQQAIDNAFVSTFKIIMLIGAVVCWLSGILSWFFIEKRLEPVDV